MPPAFRERSEHCHIFELMQLKLRILIINAVLGTVKYWCHCLPLAVAKFT